MHTRLLIVPDFGPERWQCVAERVADGAANLKTKCRELRKFKPTKRFASRRVTLLVLTTEPRDWKSYFLTDICKYAKVSRTLIVLVQLRTPPNLLRNPCLNTYANRLACLDPTILVISSDEPPSDLPDTHVQFIRERLLEQ